MRAFPRVTAEDVGVGRKRRWRLPPPLTQDGAAPGPEGLVILDEVSGELGVLLWKSLRSVLLWAEQDAASRLKLFDDNAADRRQLEILASVPDDDIELREALEDLLAVLAKPDRVDREFVALACTRIATWAEGRKALATTLEYMQAAAACSPADPVPALAAGRAARDLAKYGRAEAWIYRAVGLARQAKDWRTYVDAYRAHGTMMRQRGALPAARRSYLKALRRSRRQGDREREALTLHGLFVIERRSDNVAEALRYAEAAVHAYAPDHPRFPHLAHDIAYQWLERGEAENALPVFLEMINKVDPRERPVVLGSVARAGAASNDARAYDWARRELEHYGHEAGVAEAWVDLARGAIDLGRYEEAEVAARTAESVARQRREGQMRFLAEAILENIEREREAESTAVADSALQVTNVRLARDLMRSLQSAPDRSVAGAVG